MLSSAEENYLKAIYKYSSPRSESVSTNTIAQELSTSPASVTDMLKKLANKGLLDYEKYQGVRLSPQGTQIATMLVRKHRLWETFLVNKLDFAWDEVHDVAEQLEHIQSDLLIEKLDKFLDHPKYDPHGDPIPNIDGKFTLRDQQLLSSINIGERVSIVGVKRHDSEFLRYLTSINLALGSIFDVIKRHSFDQSISISTLDNNVIVLSPLVCESLYVKSISV